MSGIYLWLAIFMAGAIAVPAIKPEEPTSTNMLKRIRRMFSKQPKAAVRLCWESLERPEVNHRLPALCQRLFVKQGDWQAGIRFRKRAAELDVLVHFDQYPGQLYRGTNFRHKKLWDTHLFRSAALLEHSFHKIQAEFRAALEAGKLDPFLAPEGSTLKTRGEWNILHFYRVGTRQPYGHALLPYLAHIIDQLPEATSCIFGQTLLSFIHPGRMCS